MLAIFKAPSFKTKPLQRTTALTLILSLALGLTLPIVGLITPPTAKASVGDWWNEDYRYRLPLDITSSTTQSNVYYQLQLDTTSNTNPDCSDLRFLDQSGTTIPHHLVSGCGTANTQIQLLFTSLPSGTTPIYLYYSNPQATTISSPDPFNNPATSTIHTPGAPQSSPSPIAHWKLDEGYGTTTNSSTTTNYPATLTNNPAWQPEQNCPSGKCLYFDGVDDYIDTSYQSYASTITVSLWAKANSLSSNSMFLISKRIPRPGQEWALALSSDNHLYVVATNASGSQNIISLDYAKGVELNTWNHITFTIDGSIARLYLNGAQVATSAQTAPLHDAGARVIIGRCGQVDNCPYGSQRYFHGSIDEPKIYAYARTQQQIQYDYLQGIQSLTHQQANLTNGLVAHYQFNEQSYDSTPGEVKDSSGNANHAQAQEGAITGPGKYGSAAILNGTTNYLQAPKSGLQSIAPSGSIGGWVYYNSAATNFATIIDVASTGVNGLILFAATDSGTNRPMLQLGDGSSVIKINATANLPQNTWHHVLGTWDNTTAKLYIDGQLNAQTQVTPNISLLGNYAYLGAHYNGSSLWRYLNGSLDDFRIYNRSLTSTEITQLYNTAPSPIAYYDFEEGSGSTLQNKSTNDHPGAWTGTGDRYTQGQSGKAGTFNGTDTRVEVPSLSTRDWSQSYTISTWINPTQFGNPGSSCVDERRYVLTQRLRDGGTDYQLEIFLRASGTLLFRHVGQNTIGDGASISSPVIPLNQWSQITAINDAAAKTLSLYLNGQKISTVAYTQLATLTGGNPFKIGHDNFNCSPETHTYYQGAIDNLKIYNYPRTPAQILADMQSTNLNQLLPLAHYNLNEQQGTIAHNSGALGPTLNGTLENNPQWSSGKHGKALSFDGTTTRVNVGDNLDLLDSDLSISAWINPRSYIEFAGIVTKLTTYGNYRMTMGSGPSYQKISLGIRSSDGTYQSLTSVNVIPLNAWTHVTITLQGSVGTIYLNGQQDNTTSSLTAIRGDTATPLYIGWNPNNNAGFDGSIDEVKLYNSALTPQQIAIDYNQSSAQVIGTPSTEPTLTGSGNPSTKPSTSQSSTYCVPGSIDYCVPPTGEWLFEQKDGTVKDTSGNNHHGTLQNGATIVSGKIGSAADFSASSTATTVPVANNLSQLLGPDGSFAISAWVKVLGYPDYGAAGSTLLGSRTAGGAGLSYLNTPSGGGQGLVITGGGSTTYYPVIGQWVHITVIHNASTGMAELWANGRKIGEKAAPAAWSQLSAASGLAIGSSWWGTASFSGLIDQVRLYNYPRTPSQIAWDYNHGKPIAHYKLDECSNTTIHDSSGNNHHGQLSLKTLGATTIGTCNTPATAWSLGKLGKYNASLNFDGQDDIIEIPYPSLINPTAGTISLWYKPPTNQAPNDGASFIFSRPDGNNNRVYLTIAPGTNAISCHLRTMSPAIGTTQPKLNQWNHLLCSWDDTQARFYLNGQNKTLTPTFSGITSSTANLYLGNQSHAIQGATGQIDDLQIFNYALTDKQIQTLYNNGAVYWGE